MVSTLASTCVKGMQGKLESSHLPIGGELHSWLQLGLWSAVMTDMQIGRHCGFALIKEHQEQAGNPDSAMPPARSP